MRTQALFIAVILMILSSGCVNTKHIYKNNTIFDIETPPEDLSGKINTHKLNEGLEATIIDKGDYLEIVPVNKVTLPTQNTFASQRNYRAQSRTAVIKKILFF